MLHKNDQNHVGHAHLDEVDRTRPRGIDPVTTPTAAVTLVEGATFCVAGRDGDLSSERADGLFVRDTRVLSHFELRVDGARIEPLTVLSAEPFECVFVGRAGTRAGNPEPTVIVERHRLVGQGMREDITIRNFGVEAAGLDVTVSADADFADLFEVKEHRPSASARVRRAASGDTLSFTLGNGDRSVRVSARGGRAMPGTLTFAAVVPPRGTWQTTIEVIPTVEQQELAAEFPTDRSLEDAAPARRMRGWRATSPAVDVENTVLADAIRQSERDLGALRIKDPDHPEDDVVAAGAPWFMALFGRDSLLTSSMMLPFAPSLAMGTLRTLARLQGAVENPLTEEQPGKILHEVRLGADLSLALGGDSVYYGSVDATALFVTLIGRALHWGVPRAELEPLRGATDRAMQWILQYGDRDGDGFVEYERSTDRGLQNQGWKDSLDAIADQQGRQARTPIALAEVQAYTFAAYQAKADIDEAFGDPEAAAGWRLRADRLRQEFDRAFWMPDEGFYAMALDADKRQVDAISSNIGHCLWCGIIPEEKADRVIERLLLPDMFTGFGIRTRSARSRLFNPVSYHNGSVWPHDTVLTAAGMARYGRRDCAEIVLRGLLDALEAFGGRLPELFCGFDRDDKPVPVPYPTSCSPQAWASATPYEMLRIAIGLEADVPRGRVDIEASPAEIGAVRIDNLPLGTDRVDLVATPQGSTVRPHPADSPALELART